jgi:hypothetical protein
MLACKLMIRYILSGFKTAWSVGPLAFAALTARSRRAMQGSGDHIL